MLSIKNLYISIGDKEILKGVDLTIKPGEVHAVMGPNGSGKSTLAYAVMGHPAYKITNKSQKSNSKTEIKLDGKDLLKLAPDELAKLGLFLAFQSPTSIPGVSVGKFLRHLYKIQDSKIRRSQDPKNTNRKIDIQSALALNKILKDYSEKLHIKKELLNRSLNDNFSGGEKKKIETLQMLFLKPKYVLIDEIDTGLDVDSLKVVAESIAELKKEKAGILIITHYNRILHYIKPDYVHVMMAGKIVKSGDANLAKVIEEKGYERIAK